MKQQQQLQSNTPSKAGSISSIVSSSKQQQQQQSTSQQQQHPSDQLVFLSNNANTFHPQGVYSQTPQHTVAQGGISYQTPQQRATPVANAQIFINQFQETPSATRKNTREGIVFHTRESSEPLTQQQQQQLTLVVSSSSKQSASKQRYATLASNSNSSNSQINKNYTGSSQERKQQQQKQQQQQQQLTLGSSASSSQKKSKLTLEIARFDEFAQRYTPKSSQQGQQQSQSNERKRVKSFVQTPSAGTTLITTSTAGGRQHSNNNNNNTTTNTTTTTGSRKPSVYDLNLARSKKSSTELNYSLFDHHSQCLLSSNPRERQSLEKLHPKPVTSNHITQVNSNDTTINNNNINSSANHNNYKKQQQQLNRQFQSNNNSSSSIHTRDNYNTNNQVILQQQLFSNFNSNSHGDSIVVTPSTNGFNNIFNVQAQEQLRNNSSNKKGDILHKESQKNSEKLEDSRKQYHTEVQRNTFGMTDDVSMRREEQNTHGYHNNNNDNNGSELEVSSQSPSNNQRLKPSQTSSFKSNKGNVNIRESNHHQQNHTNNTSVRSSSLRDDNSIDQDTVWLHGSAPEKKRLNDSSMERELLNLRQKLLEQESMISQLREKQIGYESNLDINRITNGSNNRLETVIRAAGGNNSSIARTAQEDDTIINGRIETTDGIDGKENKIQMKMNALMMSKQKLEEEVVYQNKQFMEQQDVIRNLTERITELTKKQVVNERNYNSNNIMNNNSNLQSLIMSLNGNNNNNTNTDVDNRLPYDSAMVMLENHNLKTSLKEARVQLQLWEERYTNLETVHQASLVQNNGISGKQQLKDNSKEDNNADVGSLQEKITQLTAESVQHSKDCAQLQLTIQDKETIIQQLKRQVAEYQELNIVTQSKKSQLSSLVEAQKDELAQVYQLLRERDVDAEEAIRQLRVNTGQVQRFQEAAQAFEKQLRRDSIITNTPSYTMPVAETKQKASDINNNINSNIIKSRTLSAYAGSSNTNGTMPYQVEWYQQQNTPSNVNQDRYMEKVNYDSSNNNNNNNNNNYNINSNYSNNVSSEVGVISNSLISGNLTTPFKLNNTNSNYNITSSHTIPSRTTNINAISNNNINNNLFAQNPNFYATSANPSQTTSLLSSAQDAFKPIARMHNRANSQGDFEVLNFKKDDILQTPSGSKQSRYLWQQ